MEKFRARYANFPEELADFSYCPTEEYVQLNTLWHNRFRVYLAVSIWVPQERGAVGSCWAMQIYDERVGAVFRFTDGPQVVSQS